MKKIGITGTLTGFTLEQDAALSIYLQDKRVLKLVNKSLEIHHGMAEGVDTTLGNIFYESGFRVVGHPGLTKDRKVWKRGNCSVTEQREEKYFIYRNQDIVNETNELWAFPKETNTRRSDGTWTPIRSGTWATIRYAESQGKKVVIFWPDGHYEIIPKR